MVLTTDVKFALCKYMTSTGEHIDLPNYAISNVCSVLYQSVINTNTGESISIGKIGAYSKVSLRMNGKTKIFLLHRLRCTSFKGFPIDSRYSVDHFDRDPANNDLSNLSWKSPNEQMQNRGKFLNIGLQRAIYGVDPSGNKIEFISIREACRILNVSRITIHNSIKNDRTIPNGWKFFSPPVVLLANEEFRQWTKNIQISNFGRVRRRSSDKYEYYITPLSKARPYQNIIDSQGNLTGLHRAVIALFGTDEDRSLMKDSGYVVNHKDMDKHNNGHANLEVIDFASNVKHAMGKIYQAVDKTTKQIHLCEGQKELTNLLGVHESNAHRYLSGGRKHRQFEISVVETQPEKRARVENESKPLFNML
jgi:hypothetical protein